MMPLCFLFIRFMTWVSVILLLYCTMLKMLEHVVLATAQFLCPITSSSTDEEFDLLSAVMKQVVRGKAAKSWSLGRAQLGVVDSLIPMLIVDGEEWTRDSHFCNCLPALSRAVVVGMTSAKSISPSEAASSLTPLAAPTHHHLLPPKSIQHSSFHRSQSPLVGVLDSFDSFRGLLLIQGISEVVSTDLC